MIGNLFLKFKLCPLDGCTFVLANSKAHECCISIGLTTESDLDSHLEERIEEVLRESKCIPIQDNEYVYDLEYNFEEIALQQGEDDSDVEYDFRKMLAN